MALQMCSTAISTALQNWGWSIVNPKQAFIGDYPCGCYDQMMMRRRRKVLRLVQGMGLRVIKAGKLDAVGQVTEVNIETFWPTVEAAGGKAVVLDMYTQWCGPCKLMAPKFQKLSEKYQDVVFLKLDCNQHNRPLAKELGIKVVPTFKIFKDSKIVKEVTGAKFDDLVVAIENARCSATPAP